jgi:hypothetical protein
MSISSAQLFEFIRRHRYGVAATTSANGAPQASLVGFIANERLELFFDSFAATRKVANLQRDPRIAFVIGGHTIGDERTVQIDGTVDSPVGAELEQLQAEYFAALPDGRRRSKLPGILYFRIRPTWVRFSDYNPTPPNVTIFEGAELRKA